MDRPRWPVLDRRLTLCDGSVLELLPGEEIGGVYRDGSFHRNGCRHETPWTQPPRARLVSEVM